MSLYYANNYYYQCEDKIQIVIMKTADISLLDFVYLY